LSGKTKIYVLGLLCLFWGYRSFAQSDSLLTALKKTLTISDSIGDTYGVMRASLAMSNFYESKKDYDNAYILYQKYSTTKDSIFKETKGKDIGKLEAQHEYDKQQAVTEAERKKELELAGEKEKRQRLLSYTGIAGLVVVLLFAFFTFNRLRLTRKQKQIIEEQKQLVEMKQKEILDSIHYAKRIQKALITSEKYFEKNLRKIKNEM
jgi:hypothetical protein